MWEAFFITNIRTEYISWNTRSTTQYGFPVGVKEPWKLFTKTFGRLFEKINPSVIRRIFSI